MEVQFNIIGDYAQDPSRPWPGRPCTLLRLEPQRHPLPSAMWSTAWRPVALYARPPAHTTTAPSQTVVADCLYRLQDLYLVAVGNA